MSSYTGTVNKVERTRKAVRTARLERVNAKTAFDLVSRVFILVEF